MGRKEFHIGLQRRAGNKSYEINATVRQRKRQWETEYHTRRYAAISGFRNPHMLPLINNGRKWKKSVR